MSQIPFALTLPTRYGRDNFLVSPSNQRALGTIERWPAWPDPVLLLVGPAGSGKTHLCHIWADLARARVIDGRDLAHEIAAIATAPLAIDDPDRVDWPEAEFFHLLNLVRQARIPLLITARHPPDRWNLRTPDLLSRLRQAPIVSIDPPDEALVRAVLVKLFDDRQIHVDATLIDYLTLRLDRSLDVVRTVVEALDTAGLSRGSRITRAMAAGVLETLRLDSDEGVSSFERGDPKDRHD